MPQTSNAVLRPLAQGIAGNLVKWAASSAARKVDSVTDRLTDYAKEGGTGLLAAVTGSDSDKPVRGALQAGVAAAKDGAGRAIGKLGRSGTRPGKATDIVETVDIGAPLSLTYNQWTQFSEFPSFLHKVENVEQVSDEQLQFTARMGKSRRTWESTIEEQVPDQRIVWRSKGAKGYVNGGVTFHELAPELTRVIVALEYHPKGLFERTGNIFHGQRRRARMELRHFQRHVMTQAVLHPDEVDGWRGEIHEGEVTPSTEGDPPEAESSGAEADSEQGAESPARTRSTRQRGDSGRSRSDQKTRRRSGDGSKRPSRAAAANGEE